jgi:hypothetical protein
MTRASGAGSSTIDPALTRRHLVRMRAVAGIAIALPIIASAVGLVLEPRSIVPVPRLAVTGLAICLALWFAVSAERDARRRLEMIKRGFVVHGEQGRLQREHLGVYVAVLLRLEAIVICGLMISIGGNGPVAAVPVHVIALIQIARTWPTEHKVLLLLRRAMAGTR